MATTFCQYYYFNYLLWRIITDIDKSSTNEIFTNLNLSPRDAAVYEALLRKGVSSIRHVAEATGINRGSVYESIKDLMAAGLVRHQQLKASKRYFAEDPSKLIDLIKKRRVELNQAELQAKTIIPDLLSMAAYLPYGNIRFYEDHEGVAEILRDVLHTVSQLPRREYCAISSRPMRQYIYKKFPGFTRERIKQKINVRVIAVGEGGDIPSYASRKWLTVPTGEEPSNYQLIYGYSFALIALNDGSNPYGIVIKDPGVAAMQKHLFSHLWKSL